MSFWIRCSGIFWNALSSLGRSAGKSPSDKTSTISWLLNSFTCDWDMRFPLSAAMSCLGASPDLDFIPTNSVPFQSIKKEGCVADDLLSISL